MEYICSNNAKSLLRLFCHYTYPIHLYIGRLRSLYDYYGVSGNVSRLKVIDKNEYQIVEFNTQGIPTKIIEGNTSNHQEREKVIDDICAYVSLFEASGPRVKYDCYGRVIEDFHDGCGANDEIYHYVYDNCNRIVEVYTEQLGIGFELKDTVKIDPNERVIQAIHTQWFLHKGNKVLDLELRFKYVYPEVDKFGNWLTMVEQNDDDGHICSMIRREIEYFTDEELSVIERQGTDKYSEDGKTFLNYVGKNHSINSYRVKDGTLRIDDFAFSWNPYDDEDEESDILTLETIQLPDGLQEIGEGAFDGCLNLKQLIIPDSVNQIGQGALRNLNSIEYIHLPSSLVTMKEDLIQSTSLRFLSIPQGVRFIRQGSISCENLETLEMPASIEEVDEYSICCNNLKVIKFNAGKERMEELWENEGTHSYGGYKYDVNHFVGIPQKAVLYVPSAAYEVYRRFFPDNSIITY